MSKNEISRRIARVERRISESVLVNMLEPWMLEALEWFKGAVREAMSQSDGPHIKGASFGEHVDKKGWGFDHTSAQPSLYELFYANAPVKKDKDGHIYRDISIRNRRENVNGFELFWSVISVRTGNRKDFSSVRTVRTGNWKDFSSVRTVRTKSSKRENLDISVFSSILKYISSSHLDLIPLLEVSLLDHNIAKIIETYKMDRKYVVAHLKGCLALIASQKGLCNTAAAEPFVYQAQEYKLHKNALTKRVRSLCGV